MQNHHHKDNDSTILNPCQVYNHEIFKRDNWTCQSCNEEHKTLVVHHKIYLQATAPWNYPNELLITLCENCHNIENELRWRYEQLLLKLLREKFLVDDLFTICLLFERFKLPLNIQNISTAYKYISESPKVSNSAIGEYPRI